ncbi:MAG: coproporphyrinogen III oxidase [Crocinitomix sp. MedPE-SWsnd]|nr:MAG: coproporphyrinogen III oxidase [Crocinitomix sp. MedPE-SWsnd]
MAGVYVHIPFCKQKCHYCDFHFSTNLSRQDEMVDAICQEIILRKEYLADNKIETIYFGGGTPSLLSQNQITKILNTISECFDTLNVEEITLEANPDDLSKDVLKAFYAAGVNRLSIGIQSFDEDVLQQMNRAHNSTEATESIRLAQQFGFSNLTADLIYGIPEKPLSYWKDQVQQMIDLGVKHISAYCLTIEQNTVFNHLENKGELNLPNDEESLEQFNYLVNTLAENGYEQYEISNFAKQGYISKHNSAYWQGKSYLGVGPSAHSYDGNSRSWNIRNNSQYIKSLQKSEIPLETEVLTFKDKFNDYVLTRLRTKWGLLKEDLPELLGAINHSEFSQIIESHISRGCLKETDQAYVLTPEGKFIADKLAADLFV